MADNPSPNDGPLGVTSARLDDETFDALYKQFAGGVRAVLRSKLPSEADVEDCFSRVFEKLWRHGEAVRPAARGAWLFVVARREAALHWRLTKRSGEVLESLALSRDCETDDAPGRSFVELENAESIERASKSLSKEQRDVLRLRFVEDLSFQEIADQLRIPIGTALSRMHAAIKKMRKQLDE